MKKLILVLSFAIIVLLGVQMLASAQCGDDPIAPAIEVAFDELVALPGEADDILLEFSCFSVFQFRAENHTVA